MRFAITLKSIYILFLTVKLKSLLFISKHISLLKLKSFPNATFFSVNDGSVKIKKQ